MPRSLVHIYPITILASLTSQPICCYSFTFWKGSCTHTKLFVFCESISTLTINTDAPYISLTSIQNTWLLIGGYLVIITAGQALLFLHYCDSILNLWVGRGTFWNCIFHTNPKLFFFIILPIIQSDLCFHQSKIRIAFFTLSFALCLLNNLTVMEMTYQ